jgi:carbamoylphosphate synthase large subunit
VRTASRVVVVTGVGGPAGAAVARAVAGVGGRVIGLDARPARVEGVHDLRVCPSAAEDDYIPWLSRLAEDVDAWLVVPTVSEELPIIARAAELGLMSSTHVLVAPAAAVVVADDKWLTHLCLRQARVQTPRSWLPSALIPRGGPWVVKPRVARGGRGVVVVEQAEWPAAHNWGDDHVVQDFLGGPEYVVDVHRGPCGVDASVVLEKLALRGGRVGNAVRVRRVNEPDLEALARQAVDSIGLTGPADIDVRLDDEGVPHVLEVNARFGAHTAHAPEVLLAALESARRVGSDRTAP